MKKVLSLAMVAVVIVSAVFFSVSKAKAAGIITYKGGHFVWGKGMVFVFEASGLRNKDVKDARIFAGSNFHDLYCSINKEEGKIACVAGGGLTKYTGQTGVIHLGGQIFYVTIPGRGLPRESGIQEPLACKDPETLGAQVTFQVGEGKTQSFFLVGQTLQDVQSIVNNLMTDSWGNFSGPEISDLKCGIPSLIKG